MNDDSYMPLWQIRLRRVYTGSIVTIEVKALNYRKAMERAEAQLIGWEAFDSVRVN